jgi:hypothetical protein
LTQRAWRALALLALCAAGGLLAANEAFARPGAGDAFGGGDEPSFDVGGGSEGDGGGEVDIGFVIELIILCIRYPALGAVVVVAAGGYFAFSFIRAKGLKDWSVGAPPTRVHAARHASVARSALDRLREKDPAFSVVLLEDFVYTLYGELQIHRPRGALERLAAFVAPEVRQELADPTLEAVHGVIIGAFRFSSFRVQGGQIELAVEVAVNLTEVRGGQPVRYYAVDRVHFVRAESARSRPPARARKLDCGHCGAPLESIRGTRCGYCHNEVGGGRLDWMVRNLVRVKTEARPPLFTGTVAERGNQLPTLVDPGANARLKELVGRDPGSTPDAIWARIALVFAELQRGWSARDLAPIRPYVSDNLFQYFGYWIDLYRETRARNVTENARVVRIELANVLSDAFYDAVTVRLFATGLDYTLADDGRLLSGDRSRERPYSEYWTLIRGSATRGRPRAEPVCPNCGAPLKIAMGGNCEYCQARVVSGDFDWVLSRIEQDEAYGG